MPKTAPNVDVNKELQAAAAALRPATARLKKALEKLDPEALPLGAAADLLYNLRQTSTALGRLADSSTELISPAVRALEDHFINQLNVGEASGVQGMGARVQVTESAVPVVKPEDWTKFWGYVAKHKAWELLPRSVNREGWRERLDAKKPVPGVGVFHAKKVSCTKLSGKGR